MVGGILEAARWGNRYTRLAGRRSYFELGRVGKTWEVEITSAAIFLQIGRRVADPVISDRLLRKSPPGKSATLISIQNLLASVILSVWSMGTGLGLDHIGSFFTFTAGAGFALLLLLWFGWWALKPYHQTS